MSLDHAKVVGDDLASGGVGLVEGAGRKLGLDVSTVLAAHGGSLHARALWLTKTRSDAADLLQDTWERALRSAPRAIDPDSVLRWLLIIMHNRFLDDRRAQVVRRCVSDSDRLLDELPVDAAHPAPLWRTIGDDLLRACIARLPGPMQDLLRLRADGLSYAALSLRFQIPINTVGTRLLRIRARLERYLREALSLDAGDLPPASPTRRRALRRPAPPRLAVARRTRSEIA